MATSAPRMASIKPANVGDKQYLVNLLRIYLPNLQAKMDVSSVTPHLASDLLLSLGEVRDINELASRDRKLAVVMLMNTLTKSTDPNWFHKFKDALRKSGQQIIFKLVNLEDVRDEEAYETLLLMHYAAVTNAIDPVQLLPALLQRKTITEADSEEIRSESGNRGKYLGAQKLLTCISCRKNGWFVDFIAALKKANYTPVVELFGPKFVSAVSDMSIAREADIIVNNTSPPRFNHGHEPTIAEENVDIEKSNEFKKSVTSLLTEECQFTPKTTQSTPKTTQSTPKTTQSTPKTAQSIPKTTQSTPKTAQSIPKTTQSKQDFDQPITHVSSSIKDDLTSETDESPDIVFLREDEPEDNGLASLCDLLPGQSSRASSAAGQLTQQSGPDARAPLLPSGDRIMTDGEQSGSYSCLDLQSDWSQRNDLPSQMSSHGHSDPRKPSLTASANIFDSTMSTMTIEEEPDVPITKETLELRGYQKELADKGVDGKNCVIVAPTGSGKTHVAMYISLHHLESCIEEDRKILFFVPKVALVQQQRRQYLKYMNDACKVFSVSGEKDAQMSMKQIIEKNDVIVLTPQILLNAIESGDMDGSFSQVTLMIFDECHHAMKDHPYNNIMSKYMDVVLSRVEEDINRLPQVIGLTASPGVGKARSDDEAIEHLMKLCANLNAYDICTVRQMDNLAELRQNVNVPIEDIEEVKGRTVDRFHDVISRIMGEIEAKMRQRDDINQLMVEAPNIQKVLEPPGHGIEAYTQFLALLKREVAKIYDQGIRRFFLSCQEHLDVYNNALLINADCRTIDAVEFIRNQFQQRNSGHRASLTNNETDLWLNSLYSARAMDLEQISQSPEAANPKLKYLEILILRYYRENRDSQGIIFCKTRYMTDALVKWIKDTPCLVFLNPHNLVGAGSTTARTGGVNPVAMTHHKLDDVLKYFKGGIHKLIVSTSVAEEGLDVKSCNYIIRYEHVTNDIARVQSRGRARAKDAKSVLVTEKGRGVHEREMMNQVKEKLMGRAIFLVHQMPDEEMRSRITIQQELAKQERDMAAAAKVANAKWKASRSHDGEYQLRCFKCNELGVWNADLRTIKGSHHVVIDPDFKSRIVVEPHPRPKAFDDFEKTGKVLCRRCGLDWGVSALYKNVPVYMLKVCSFAVEDPDSQRSSYKKWKDVPFPVSELLPGDMRRLPSVFLGRVDE